MGLVIRPLENRDSAAVRDILTACRLFTDEEVRVALELMNEGLAGGLTGDYPLFAAEVEGALRGYVCIGKISLTRGTWHLYWIAVHPAVQARGIGRALQAHAEDFIRSRGGERLALETSSRVDYERTRRFYRHAGYTQVGYIRDFYKPGDDCVMFCKVLTPPPEA
jgi:ribosomal protein S18 acetylase RimI-like enzyme